MSTKNFDKLKGFLDTFLDTGLPGFDCVIYYDGECVLRHSGGYADAENKIRHTGRELYNIYSCSKPITCTAALQLFEKGLLRLEDRLSDFIPEFETMYVACDAKTSGATDGINLSDLSVKGDMKNVVKAKNPITIKDLFCMTGGFSYDTVSPQLMLARKATDGRCPTVETVKYLAKEPLLFEPGTNHAYSLCHDVLAAVVEVVSGKSFGQYVKENIFNPLDMKDSTFNLPESQLDRVAEQYRYNEQTSLFENVGKEIQTYKLGAEFESGGAGCVSSVDDYIKFTEALRKGDIILKRETIDMMTIPRVREDQYVNELYNYGLGVRCPKKGSPATDFGWGGAAGAYLAIDRPQKVSLFYAQHALNSPNNRSNQIIWEIKKILNEY
ncbi:MAG: beta-lactamase family protein [Clostridia bacterium]|nr:beta-lactamase family protein [Clostridia bacterium]